MIIAYHEINNDKLCGVNNTYFAKRISEYVRNENKLRTYISYKILKKLAKQYDIELDDIEIIKDKNGKPRAKNNEFYFNISHSENMVVVAIDSQEIGIDVEQIRKFDPRVAQKFFAHKIEGIAKSPTPDIEFTKQWTIFEAKLKYWGNIELIRNNFEPNTFSTHLTDKNNLKYILTVATKQDISNTIKIEKL